MSDNTAIERAVDAAGSQSALARELGVTHQAVQQWVADGKPPVRRAIDIEIAVNGAVTREELRPDIYRPLPESA